MFDKMWPEVPTPFAFDAIARDETALRPGIDAITARLALRGDPIRYADGSLPVYAVGEHAVLKVYPPIYADERAREHLVLSLLANRLPIPTPRPLATGEVEGWGYVLMSRLAGESLATRWAAEDGEGIGAAVGRCLAALHAIPVAASAELPDQWLVFEADQRRTCVERQRARGLEVRWLAQIPAFLEGLVLGGPTVLLHTEIMREHLRVEGGRLTGLFDFEPAMLGPSEYEFASVGVFLSGGDRRVLRSLLLAYGYSPQELTSALSRRLLGYALLHRYSKLSWYLERVPPPPGASTLDALAEAWFGVSP